METSCLSLSERTKKQNTNDTKFTDFGQMPTGELDRMIYGCLMQFNHQSIQFLASIFTDGVALFIEW